MPAGCLTLGKQAAGGGEDSLWEEKELAPTCEETVAGLVCVHPSHVGPGEECVIRALESRPLSVNL